MIQRRRMIGWAIMIIPFALWITAIGSASSHGFFENSFAVQVMILGGAVSMIAGAFLFFD
ncbi:MAG: hypothetical protein ACYCPW_12975 [Nitrososphaerales archaeon]